MSGDGPDPMSAMRELREDIIAAGNRQHRDFLDQLSASSLRMMFNAAAPPELRIGASATLRIHLGSRRPTSREVAAVTKAVTAAVASIGHDIRHQAVRAAASQRIPTAADYKKTPVYVQASGGNLIVIRPGSPEFVEPVGSNTGSTSERALSRLTNILPEARNKDDLAVIRDAVGADRADRIALNRIAEAARHSAGLAVEWETPTEIAEGFLSVGHAEELVKVLAEAERSEKLVTIRGRLDGMRVTRRQFWLERADGDINGTIDEAVMPRVQEFIDDEVEAQVVRTTYATRSGKASRPSYRLVDLHREPQLPQR